MEELIALVGGTSATRRGLGLLMERLVGKVLTVPFATLAEVGPRLGEFRAFVLLDVQPSAEGDLDPGEFDRLKRLGTHYREPVRLTVICTVHIDEPVFVTTLAHVPGRTRLVDQTKANWAEAVLLEVEAHFRDYWLEQSWDAFFAPKFVESEKATWLHPSTHLALLKRELEWFKSRGCDIVGQELINGRFLDGVGLRVRTVIGNEDVFERYLRPQATKKSERWFQVRGGVNDTRLTAVHNEVKRAVEALTDVVFRFPKPKRPMEIIVAEMHPVTRRMSPFLETRAFGADVGVVLYVPQQALTRLGWEEEVRVQTARGLLRSLRPTPLPRAAIFEEALAEWATEDAQLRRPQKEQLVRAGISIDSPRNPPGVRALIDYLSQRSRGRFPIRLWELGEHGILQAVRRYFARPLETTLEEFFWWAYQESRLALSNETPPRALGRDVLDHASYWFGSAPAGNGVEILTYPSLRCVRPYGLPSKPRYADKRLSDFRLPVQFDANMSLLVLNLGQKHRSEFLSHDRVRWSISLGTAE